MITFAFMVALIILVLLWGARTNARLRELDEKKARGL